MSNRRKSKVLIKCQRDDCKRAAVTMRRAPHDLGGQLKEGSPIFVCADHVKELEEDLRQAIFYHNQALERQNENN